MFANILSLIAINVKQRRKHFAKDKSEKNVEQIGKQFNVNVNKL